MSTESTNPWQSSGYLPAQPKTEISPWWGITAGLALVIAAGYTIVKVGEAANKEQRYGKY